MMCANNDHGVNLYDVVVDEYVQRLREGRDASVDEFARRHPDLAHDIETGFPVLALIEKVKRDVAAEFETNAASQETSSHLHMPTRLGDYRIVREIGRGGMGIVYEAHQASLDRRVALKLLLPQGMLEPVKIERFRREALAAARLHHTNIVTVFGAGCDAGIQYLVMQYIRGASLDDVVQQLLARRSRQDQARHAANECDGAAATSVSAAGSNDTESAPDATEATKMFSVETALPLHDYWRSVAAVGVQIASALAHAHAQGTVHRDLKPSNLLMDASGAVWVTDFGLAKLAEEDDLTRSGEMLGTLRYQAPESLRGRYDVRGDIYSLGLTLFELCALRPARAGETREQLLRQIESGEIASLHRIVVGVPRDLATIVHKCLDADPARRYQRAVDLQNDLDRFRDGRPVRARRIGIGERAWRWCRRNPAIATTTFVATLIVVVIAAVAFVSIDRSRSRAWTALSGEQAERRDAQEARQLAERRADEIAEHYRIARQVVHEFLIELSADNRLKSAGLENLRRSLAQKAATSYDQLLELKGDDERLLADRATAYTRLGRVLWEVGAGVQAAAMHEKALANFRELVDKGDSAWRYRASIASTQLALGDIYLKLDRLQAAERCFHQCLQERARLAAEFPTSFNQLGRLSSALRNVAVFYEATHRGDDAEMLYVTAIGVDTWVLKQESRLDPTSRGAALRSLASSYRELSAWYVQRERWHESDALVQAALKRFERLQDWNPRNPVYPEKIALSKDVWSRVLRRIDRADEAVKRSHEAVAALRTLRRQRPEARRYQGQLARLQLSLAQALFAAGRAPAAIAEATAAIDLFRERAAKHADQDRYWRDLGMAEIAYGELLHSTGAAEAANRQFEEGLERFERLANADGNTTLHKAYLASALGEVALVFARSGQSEAAITKLEEQIAVVRPLTNQVPRDARFARALAQCYRKLAELRSSNNDVESAQRLRSEAEEIHRRLPQAVSPPPRLTIYASLALRNMAVIYRNQRHLNEAVATARRAVDLLRPLASANPTNDVVQAEVNESEDLVATLQSELEASRCGGPSFSEK